MEQDDITLYQLRKFIKMKVGSGWWYYIPYLSQITHIKSSVYSLRYQGGECQIDLSSAISILFLGESGDLPSKFLFACRKHRVSLTLTSTHLDEPMVFHPHVRADRYDLLTKQLKTRDNIKRQAAVSKALIQAQWSGRSWLVNSANHYGVELKISGHVDDIRLVEARAAALYWRKVGVLLDISGFKRSQPHPLNSLLNAAYHFVAGVLMRWVLHHGLSPYHGYLHTATSYPALVYDLLEPYRGRIERVVIDAYREDSSIGVDQVIDGIKAWFDTAIKTEPTRQEVRGAQLLHGVVLSLRHYLLDLSEEGKRNRFNVPIEVDRFPPGRKKVAFKIPGSIG
ncbi:CRISPR-associated endonuclease Cas1 [uncultured Umboniibacter sp.]|uniref:CRISPR-associated endonuclease Cas1 n=1 Tax=uncultured Umboniibacter sp. TaxID=1798917 RepID=UPI00260833AF|nr:CRISPR-associated endonuclease Cas1 [uncultured Umboniibacter sp.]